MKKRIFGMLLMGAMVVASVSMFTSCKDYDDDINELRSLIDKNAKAIDDIVAKITNGSAITEVASAADGAVTVTMGNGQQYTIYNGKDGADGKDGTVWSIGTDGYWYLNGEKTDYYALGKDGKDGAPGKDGKDGVDGKDGKDGVDGQDGADGKNGKNGKDGVNGKDGQNGKDGKDGVDGKDGKDGQNGKDGVDGKNGEYYVPNAETGCFDKYTWDATTGAYVKSATTISFIAPGVVTAVIDGSNLTLYGVKDKDGKVDPKGIVISLSNALRSIVFAGDELSGSTLAIDKIKRTYLDGVPAIKVNTFGFSALKDKNKNKAGEIWQQTTDKAGNVIKSYINPTTYAYYHVNPSNVKVEDLKNLSYVVKADAAYIVTRGKSDGFGAKAEFAEFKDGILKVKVITEGQPAESDALLAYEGQNTISTIALQATKKVADGNEVITSDYTAVYKNDLDDLIIAENNKYAKIGSYEGKQEVTYKDLATNTQKSYSTKYSHASVYQDYHFRQGDNVMSGAVNAFTNLDLNAGTLKNQIVWDNTTSTNYGEGEDPTVDWKLAYNGKYNLYDLVTVHKSNNIPGSATAVCSAAELEARGLKLEFEIVTGYNLPVPGATPAIETPQDKFISINENGEIQAEVYGETNKIAAVGRTPIIRAKLVHESGKVVRVSFIKIQWVRATAAPVGEKCYDLYLNDLGFGCNGGKLRTTVEQINTQLYTKLNMSKEQFHKAYPYFQDTFVKKGTTLKNAADDKDYKYGGDLVGWTYDATEVVAGYVPAADKIGENGPVQSSLGGMESEGFAASGSTLRNYSTGGNSTYEITLAATGDELWDHAGGQIENVVTFASGISADQKSLTGNKIQVRLIAKVNGLKKENPLTHEADYRPAYWDDAKTYTSYNVNVPNTASKWNEAECLYRNNLNMSFITYGVDDGVYNGIVKLNSVKKTDVKRVVYHFCKDMESITEIGQFKVEFKVLDNDKKTWDGTAADLNRADTLLARIKGDKTWSVIAYIQNYEIKANNDAKAILAGDAPVKDVYNLFEYNKYDNLGAKTATVKISAKESITYTTDPILAKNLLNTEKMYCLIGAYAEVCDVNTKVKTVQITYDGKDHFQANIIKPVYGEKNNGAKVYDAVNFPVSTKDANKKSYIRLEDMLDLYEWRYLFDNTNKAEYLFEYPTYTGNNYKTTGSWHWWFYGPFTITVNPTKVECDIDGTRTKIPAGFYVGYDKLGTGLFNPGVVGAAANTVNITDPTDDTPSGELVKTEFGVLTYHNNGTKLTQDRHLYVPIRVQYGWGEFTIWVEVLIKATDEA